jgi:hypothetical protein
VATHGSECYSLIVDGVGSLRDGKLAIPPSRAVLYRPASPQSAPERPWLRVGLHRAVHCRKDRTQRLTLTKMHPVLKWTSDITNNFAERR